MSQHAHVKVSCVDGISTRTSTPYNARCFLEVPPIMQHELEVATEESCIVDEGASARFACHCSLEHAFDLILAFFEVASTMAGQELR
jgi:hypothetical protein